MKCTTVKIRLVNGDSFPLLSCIWCPYVCLAGEEYYFPLVIYLAAILVNKPFLVWKLHIELIQPGVFVHTEDILNSY